MRIYDATYFAASTSWLACSSENHSITNMVLSNIDIVKRPITLFSVIYYLSGVGRAGKLPPKHAPSVIFLYLRSNVCMAMAFLSMIIKRIKDGTLKHIAPLGVMHGGIQGQMSIDTNIKFMI